MTFGALKAEDIGCVSDLRGEGAPGGLHSPQGFYMFQHVKARAQLFLHY